VPGDALNEATLARARAGDDEAFRELTEPRRELQLHCYRILGSVQDAQDVVQETLLAAWRSLDAFEGRASMRAWLYRIATNRCLNALRARSRRPREVQAMHIDSPAPARRTEPIWLEPYPDVLLEDLPNRSPGPAARYEARESIELAFIVALQGLPPGQRAAIVLRDVLGFRTAEVAAMVDTSEASVLEYQGHEAIAAFLLHRARLRGTPLRVVPTRANTQPALGFYLPDAQTAIARPYGLIVLTLHGDAIAAITWFADTGVFRHLELPEALRALGAGVPSGRGRCLNEQHRFGPTRDLVMNTDPALRVVGLA
jgi:RNA polymerase sigma factor (sigma-70 family)